jgi:tripartite-type tricarboxylate transporter receptor subunit TctC
MGGQVSGYSTTLGSYLPHLKSGKLRILAVSGVGRNQFAPDVPTFREQGYPITAAEQYGLFMPGKTPQNIVRRAAAYMQPVLTHPDVIAIFATFGMTSKPTTPQALADVIKADSDEWRRLIKQIGFTAES